MVRSRRCLGQASGQVLHGHLHDTDRITLKISHLNRWQYENRVSGNMCIGNAVFYYMRSLQALAAYELTHDGPLGRNVADPDVTHHTAEHMVTCWTDICCLQGSPELSRLSGRRHIGF